jgi:hypothetical protein
MSDEASFKFSMPASLADKPDFLPALENPYPAAAVGVSKGGKKLKRQFNTEARVTQHELRISIMVRDVNPPHDVVFLAGGVPCELQAIDRVTAENVHETQKQIYDLPGVTDETLAAFKVCIRSHTQDCCSANLKQANAARAEDSARPKKRRRLALGCEVHKVATIYTRHNELVSFHVSGLLAFAITQRGPGKFEELQAIVGDEAVSMLRIIRPVRVFHYHVSNALTLRHVRTLRYAINSSRNNQNHRYGGCSRVFSSLGFSNILR